MKPGRPAVRGGAPFTPPVPDALLTRVNLKSRFKPFYIYEPGTEIIPYGGGIREIDYRYSHFHSRNHWPVSLMPCDGRFVLAADRVTSSALTSSEPQLKRNQRGALEGRFIMGLSNQAIAELVPYAKSWLNPPELEVNDGFICNGYCRNTRSYLINRTEEGPVRLEITIKGTDESPVVNPSFTVKRWGSKDVRVHINGEEPGQENAVRTGFVSSAEGTDLIVWSPIHALQSVKFEITEE